MGIKTWGNHVHFTEGANPLRTCVS